MTIKLWHKKKEFEEVHTNLSFIEHRVLRHAGQTDDHYDEVLLLTFNEDDHATILVPLENYTVDEISQFNLGPNDYE